MRINRRKNREAAPTRAGYIMEMNSDVCVLKLGQANVAGVKNIKAV